jgi:gluconokinase
VNVRAIPSVLVTGVAGAGKSTVGRALAARLDRRFVDADDHHPPANRRRMAAGTPLTEQDRTPWLVALGDVLASADADGEPVVLAVSALRRAHRDRLAAAAPVLTVLLDVPEPVARERVRTRADHFMPADLVASQFATLDRPGPGEDVVPVDAARPVVDVVDELVRLVTGRADDDARP